MLYLGTNYGHGAAAAVVDASGSLLGAVEEGKLLGDKDTARFPSLALRWLSQAFNGPFRVWAEGWHTRRRLLQKGALPCLLYGVREPVLWNDRLVRESRRWIDGLPDRSRTARLADRSIEVGHHLAHAHSLLPAGLPPLSLILVSDTTAERHAITVFYWTGSDMRRLWAVPWPHSPGLVFHQAALHLGFTGRTAPGKLMALSAYGCVSRFPSLAALGRVVDGAFTLRGSHYPAWRRRGTAFSHYAQHVAPSSVSTAIDRTRGTLEDGKDFAAAVQAWFTRVTIKLLHQSVRRARDLYGLRVCAVGLAGGTALNCQAVGRLTRVGARLGLEGPFISPWSDDCGTAVGAAVAARLTDGTATFDQWTTPLLGPRATTRAARPLHVAHLKAAIRTLSAGGLVALASGRLEFGPRSLGGRCILANPAHQTTRTRLNAAKGRPAFMPFAPVVLNGRESEWFDGPTSRIMAFTTPIRPQARQLLPAMWHPSGQARVQRLCDGDSPVLEALLQKWATTSGHGVLLLTSLNGGGEAVPARLAAARSMAQRLRLDGLLSDDGYENLKVTA